jgi:hypothetical protein
MRRWPYSRSELVAMAVSGLFTAFGLVAGLVWPALFFGACLAIFVLSPVLRRYTRLEDSKETVEFDGAAIPAAAERTPWWSRSPGTSWRRSTS